MRNFVAPYSALIAASESASAKRARASGSRPRARSVEARSGAGAPPERTPRKAPAPNLPIANPVRLGEGADGIAPGWSCTPIRLLAATFDLQTGQARDGLFALSSFLVFSSRSNGRSRVANTVMSASCSKGLRAVLDQARSSPEVFWRSGRAERRPALGVDFRHEVGEPLVVGFADVVLVDVVQLRPVEAGGRLHHVGFTSNQATACSSEKISSSP